MLFACVNILLGLEIASDHADIDTDICHVCGTDSFPTMLCHLEFSFFNCPFFTVEGRVNSGFYSEIKSAKCPMTWSSRD